MSLHLFAFIMFNTVLINIYSHFILHFMKFKKENNFLIFLSILCILDMGYE